MALQMNVSGIRRNIKNIAHNYTDAQVKVREATSNDPWGPSSTLMSEIADLTYNVVAFSEIMQMIWKRLNDHGRNWRHVYKALVLLEYLIKTGSEKIAEQCKENIYAIQTLKDFQYLEDNKDQGMNVREKAKALVALLKDDERLRNERVRALKAKERFAQSISGIGSDSDINSPTSPSLPDNTVLDKEVTRCGEEEDTTYVTSSSRADRDSHGLAETSGSASSDLEAARPQTVGEEELQLQLALAMSKEEADQEEARRRSDDVRLQMALSQSQQDYKDHRDPPSREDKSSMNDLLDINFNPNGPSIPASISPPPPPVDPWGMPTQQPATSSSAGVSPQHSTATVPQKTDPWGSPISGPPSRVTSPPTTSDPWIPVASQPKSPEPAKSAAINDPWAPVVAPQVKTSSGSDPWSPAPAASGVTSSKDPFAPVIASTNGDVDEFSALSSREKPTKNGTGDVFDLSDIELNLESVSERPKSKSPASFLGENSNLVNLDNLVSGKPTAGGLGSPSPYASLNSISPPGFEISHAPSAEKNSSQCILPRTSSLSAANQNSDFSATNFGGVGTPGSPQASTISVSNIYSSSDCLNTNMNTCSYNPFYVPDQQHSSQSFAGVNPFSSTAPPNPFQAQQVPKPSMNQMRSAVGMVAPSPQASSTPGPWGPQPSQVSPGSFTGLSPPQQPKADDNPFLL